MFKLITADMKVLGHRLWIIPVGVFLFVMTFSFIPYLNQVQSFQNWIFIILIPGLLIFELLRENSKNDLMLSMNSLPMSSRIFVLEKYCLIVIYILISIAFVFLSEKIIDIANIGIKKVDLAQDIKIGGSIWYPIILLLWISMYSLPIFFKTKNVKKSILIAFIVTIIVPVLFAYTSFRYMYTDQYYQGIYYFDALKLITSAVIIYLVLILFSKLKKIKLSKNDKSFISIVLVMPYIFGLFSQIINNYNFVSIYKNWLKKQIEPAEIERANQFINGYYELFLVFGVLFVISIVLLTIMYRRSDNKTIKINLLLLLTPILSLIIHESLRRFFYLQYYHSKVELLKNISRHSESIWILVILIIHVFFSIKLSTKYLKENKVK